MRNWKRLMALSLGFALTFGQAAYAEVIVPPITSIGGTLGSGTDMGIGNSQGPSVNTSPSTSPDPSVGGSAGADAAGTAAAGSTAPVGSTTASVQAPEVAAEGAVLLDAATGKILYGKNQDQQFYPASITKIMTALLVLERCNLSDKVTFSSTATTNLESGAVSLNITEGDVLTVEQCLYGLLLKSANEIGNGLAEHVAGSVSGFADLMNARARELGCKNTHFANPHGLNDSTHKTTPYDMALIMRAALENSTFRKIDTTTSYNFPATKKEAARTITMGHKMMYKTDSRYYEGVIGGKTGYTSLAGNTLVTGAEKNGVRLITVVMKAKGTQYADTKAMLDYGFDNYASLTGTGAGAAAGPSAGTQNSTSGTTAAPVPETTAAAAGITAAPTPETTAASGTAAVSTPGNNAVPVSETTAAGTAAEPAGGTAQGWVQDASGWSYYKSNGSKAANEWLTLDGYEYWFDGNGYMATKWRHFVNDVWYYFDPANGRLVSSSWVEDGGAWYYLGSDGALLTNTTTPDGRKVDENGILIQQ